MSFPRRVRIVEVGPRDGLQNEAATVSVETKVALIEMLAKAGLANIEAGSFVSAKCVPQMASTAEVLAKLPSLPGVRLSVLVPNLHGLELALASGVTEIAVFAAASETFSQNNINCSIAESLERFVPVVEKAKQAGITVRGYVSCVLGCPYEGEIAPTKVAAVARDLAAIGCNEISLGDTIGVGTPLQARKLIEAVAREAPIDRLALHFHDTYGQALANIFACLELGVSSIDSSVAGLGGCPYAPGASGNVATEDVVYMLNGMGVETGVDLAVLIDAGDFISRRLGRTPDSRVSRAMMAQRKKA
ncbi:MAG: hydroxymethylglutaryl-CoA lyase [Methylocystis sp.]|nr:hydroxymethylglutaryl-CoA lyase [Methylocystis sp.]